MRDFKRIGGEILSSPLNENFRKLRNDISIANSNLVFSDKYGIMPNIGEYYTDLGICGVICIMFIFGRLLRNMRELYHNGGKRYRWVMLYSLYLPSLVTIIPYGYTAGNAPPFVLMAVPVILQKFIISDK